MAQVTIPAQTITVPDPTPPFDPSGLQAQIDALKAENAAQQKQIDALTGGGTPTPPTSTYGPKTTTTQPAGSTIVQPGTNVGNLAAGANSWLRKGVFPSTKSYNKKGSIITGEYDGTTAAVIDGNGAGGFGFQGEGGAVGGTLTVRNVELRNWKGTDPQFGLFHLFGGMTTIIEDVYAHDCQMAGLAASAADYAQVRRSRFSKFQLAGLGGKVVVIEDCELDGNGVGPDPVGASAGAKFWGLDGATRPAGFSTLVTVRRTYAHDNRGGGGHGLWCDGAVIDSLFDTCTLERNSGAGYHHECSGKGRLTGSKLRDNGYAGVYFYCGEDFEVDACVMSGSPVQVRFLQEARTDIARPGGGAWNNRNVNVHNNDITVDVSKAQLAVDMAVQGTGQASWYTTPANGFKFSGNIYHLIGGDWATAKPFKIGSTLYTRDQWKALGFDTNSTFA